jgi:hypothetical protein
MLRVHLPGDRQFLLWRQLIHYQHMLLVDQGEAAPNAQAVGIGWREVEHYNGETG